MATEQNSTQNLRRKFLVKGSAVALISGLPLKATWATGSAANGCSVSGNLSGNLSKNCTTLRVSGLSPGGWKNYYKPSHNKYRKDPSIPFDGSTECRWVYVFGIGRKPFTVPSAAPEAELWWFLPNIGQQPYHPGGGDANSNLDTALVAAYLNAKSGKYGALTVSAEDYVAGLYDQVKSGEVTATKMKAAIESTY